MKIDAHQHFWQFDPVRDSWITEDMGRIRRNFLPEDLYPLLKSSGIEACIAVQADTSLRETDFLLDLAGQYSWISGVVGWVDLSSLNLDQTLEVYSGNSKLLGFREILQSKDPQFMLREKFIQGIQAIGKKGYTYDILVYPHHLSASLELVKKCPNQKFVIDHLAKPYIKDKEWKEWKKAMQPIAERELVYCKVSGMVTEADWKNWTEDDLAPYLEIALELFGPDRLMYGSDWPVCLLAGEYGQVYEVIQNWTSRLSKSERDRILGETAAEFYHIY
ncbi:amidohydrolase family protein [Algoriphagus sp. CAU 1675]|uniref:amidohydrolase family protein n=1 Tax=Algoriphagus sp. CAU 1675 TaxID=3032597 RepID=UPI0023DA9DCF|nr:amidohydrolase family protein [Algoriphagus sp. CAU 1675]MDF2157066.1 amidohydrolase family protein [Algoriphagus sp. CAU 1675]